MEWEENWFQREEEKDEKKKERQKKIAERNERLLKEWGEGVERHKKEGKGNKGVC